jgi:hypothetical protein
MSLGQTGEVVVRLKGVGNAKADNVVVRLALPSSMRLMRGSTRIFNQGYPKGLPAGSDALVGPGINIGNYLPDANAYVLAQVKAVASAPGGSTVVGSASADNLSEVHDTLPLVITIRP